MQVNNKLAFSNTGKDVLDVVGHFDRDAPIDIDIVANYERAARVAVLVGIVASVELSVALPDDCELVAGNFGAPRVSVELDSFVRLDRCFGHDTRTSADWIGEGDIDGVDARALGVIKPDDSFWS